MTTASPCRVTVGLEYAAPDGMRLTGDFYRPDDDEVAPLVVAVHGGGWKLGSAQFYRHWGPFLAANGIALFAIDYRLVEGERNRYPAAVHDVCAALRFVARLAGRLGVDPARIALIGDSAGAHLAALTALAGDPARQPLPPIKAAAVVYGVYDLLAQWQHDLTARPNDQITEIFLGTSPIEDKISFFTASPLAYATRRDDAAAFLVAWGTADDTVDWRTQSAPFALALKQAGFFVRTVQLPDAPHFWMSDPLDEPHGHAARFAPSLLRFLRERL